MVHARLRRVGFLALVPALAACGHSGGGDPAPSLSAGAFHSVAFRAIHGSPDTLTNNVGTVVSNGVDSLTDMGSTQNENGTVSLDPGGAVIPFSLSLTGVLSLNDGLGTEHFRGGVILGGEMAAVAAVFPFAPSEAELLLMVKKGSAMSDASLTGLYHSCSFGAFVGGSHFGVLADALFDGAGGLVIGPSTQNNDGVVTPATTGSAVYGVGADGTFMLGPTYQGGVGPTGDYAIAGGGVTSGTVNDTWIFIRNADFANLSDLRGTYTLVGMGYSLANNRYYDFAGVVTSEGDGHCTVALTSNEEGVISTSVDSSTYTVGTDGTLTWVTGLLGATLKGAVSQDGRLAMIGGGVSAGSDPTLAVLFRR